MNPAPFYIEEMLRSKKVRGEPALSYSEEMLRSEKGRDIDKKGKAV